LEGLEGGAVYSFEVRTVTDEAKSEPAVSNEVEAPKGKVPRYWAITSWIFVAAAGASAIALWAVGRAAGNMAMLSCLAFACVVTFLFSLALTLADTRYGMWRMILGTDHRISTSYLQTAVWTLLVAFVLSYFAARTWFNKELGLFEYPVSDGTQTTVWDDYLILLGGPFAALVFAKGIVSAKVQGGAIQKTIADDGTASLRQALTTDSDNLDLVDSQYLIFNLVAFSYVVVALATTNRLPPVPAILLALTGSAAATYVLNKAVQSNAPAVATIAPATAWPGSRMIVEGRNFLPGKASAAPIVTIGGKSAIVEMPATEGRLTVIVPIGVPAGSQELILTTAAKVSAEPKFVKVVDDKPVIIQVSPPEPKPDTDITIRGLGFVSAFDVTSTVFVHFGSNVEEVKVTGTGLGIEEVMFHVPPRTKGAIQVFIETTRLTRSDPVTVTMS